jgi:hypothetical protein
MMNCFSVKNHSRRGMRLSTVIRPFPWFGSANACSFSQLRRRCSPSSPVPLLVPEAVEHPVGISRRLKNPRASVPDSLVEALRQHYEASSLRDGLVFPTAQGDSNLLARHIRLTAKLIGIALDQLAHPSADPRNLLSQSGASRNDAQASWSTDISYTQSTPIHQQKAVDRRAQLVTNGDELSSERRSQTSNLRKFSDLYGRPSRIRTYDFHRVKVCQGWTAEHF